MAEKGPPPARPAASPGERDGAALPMRPLDILPVQLAAYQVLKERLGAPAAHERLGQHLGLKDAEAARIRMSRAAKAVDKEVKSLGSLGFALRAMPDLWAAALAHLPEDDILAWVPTEAQPAPFSPSQAAALFEAMEPQDRARAVSRSTVLG